MERAAVAQGAGDQEIQGQDDKPKPDGSHEESHDESPLVKNMEVMQTNLKALRRMLGKVEKQADALQAVDALQGAARACLVFEPDSSSAIEDSALRAESRIGYQRRMVEVYDVLLQLELAIHKGDGAQQKTLYKALGKSKQAGHDAYN